MIFKFSITGKEEKIIEFEKELFNILLKAVNNDEVSAHEIHFCIHESILNIIQHTYKWNQNLPMDIKVSITNTNEGDLLEISITDNGPPVPKEILPPKQLDPFQLRQRGLYMINKIMDEFYIRPQGSGNITYMKKLLSSSNKKNN